MLLGASWLVNAPAAVMIHYSFVLLVVAIAWRRRSTKILITALAGVLLGALLVAFYLLPAIYEQRWVDIAQAVSYGVRPVDSFLFTRTTDPDHNAFNYVVSSVATAEVILTLLLTWWAWKRRNRSQHELWYLLAIWAAVCAVMMLPFTNVLWSYLPKLRFVQFPWRLLLCLGVPLSLLMTMGIKRWPARIALYIAMLAVMAGVGYHFQPPWWDEADDLREMQDNMATGAGYDGVEEYTPVGAFPKEIDKAERRVRVEGPAQAAIRVVDWGAERKEVSAEMSAADNLVLRLFNYPAWRVQVNGHEVAAGSDADTGEMLVPVEAGANRVQIVFVRTWDRKAGGWISLGALVFLLLFVLISIRRNFETQRAQSLAG
jgi:hypothetical protein